MLGVAGCAGHLQRSQIVGLCVPLSNDAVNCSAALVCGGMVAVVALVSRVAGLVGCWACLP